VASKQSRLEPGRLCSVWSPAAASVLRWLFETVEQLKQAIVDEWCWPSRKFIDSSINEWRRHLKCVIQQTCRHIKHVLKQLSSRRLNTVLLLQFLHICEPYSFIDLLCKLHYTRAVLCGATYRSTVKSSNSYSGLFVINCRLCQNIRLGQSVWKIQTNMSVGLMFLANAVHQTGKQYNAETPCEGLGHILGQYFRSKRTFPTNICTSLECKGTFLAITRTSTRIIIYYTL